MKSVIIIVLLLLCFGFMDCSSIGTTTSMALSQSSAAATTVISPLSKSTPAPKQERVVFAVNCGGPAYTGVDGTTYQADKDYSGGDIYLTTHHIAHTTDETVYQSERFGNFSYAIPLSNGNT